MALLYVTEKYLEDKKTKAKTTLNAINQKEYEICKRDFLEAQKYIISLDGGCSKFKSSNMYHYRPNGIGNAQRVIYSLSCDISDILKNNFRVDPASFVLFSVTGEQDHDKCEKIAKNLRENEDQYIYLPLSIVATEKIDEETDDVIYEPFYGFPIDDKQKALIGKTPPLVVIGSAGSGKTITALELFKYYYLQKKEYSVAFITLTEGLKNKVTQDLKKCNFSTQNVFTFCEYANLDYNEQDYYIEIIEKIIQKYDANIYDTKFNKLHKKFSFFINKYSIYTIIRGFIKGRLNANNKYESYDLPNDLDKLKEEIIATEDYKEFFGTEASTVVNYVFEIYEEYEKVKTKMDDNDFNRVLNRKYDCIIVDEIQDLTEKQVKSIVESCNSNLLYFYGDPNQTINPTFFSFSRLTGVIKSVKKSISEINKELLKETYRSGPYLIKYINHLSDVRKKYIGTQKDCWDEHEKSLSKSRDDKWACLIERKESLEEVFSIFFDSDDCIIIVNDEDDRKFLKENFIELTNTSLILLVTEIKGLESKNIIAYNLISKNKQRFEEILSEKYKKSTIHRMIFNRLYVSLTRARESIIICETDLTEKIKEEMFKYSDEDGSPRKVEEVDDNLELVQSYITLSKNPKAFIKSAKKFQENNFFIQAKEKFSKARDLAKENEEFKHLEGTIERQIRVLDLIMEYENEKETMPIEKKNNFAEKLLQLEETQYARKIYSETLNKDALNILEYMIGEKRLSEIYESINAKVFEREDTYKHIVLSKKFEEDYNSLINSYLK